uniref:Cytochrome c oxidase copper chaperone n=1 Tax=Arcella intermedia TaxID=1963864 RepID=A0A6B2LXE8_9EUKA
MSTGSAGAASAVGPVGVAPVAEKPKLKICCACPETKKVRDECFLNFGEANCLVQIEAHKTCLRAAGFEI